MAVSICNDVLGPVMRGPSSGHTAATWRMGNMTLQLLGEAPDAVECRFHKSGAYANVFRQQRSDLGFAAGLMDITMRDAAYDNALRLAENQGVRLAFTTPELAGAVHPNEVEVEARGASGRTVTARFRSIGGGIAALVSLDGLPVWHTGDSHAVFILAQSGGAALPSVLEAGARAAGVVCSSETRGGMTLFRLSSPLSFPAEILSELNTQVGAGRVFRIAPLMFAPRGLPDDGFFSTLFGAPQAIPRSLAAYARDYECAFLGISPAEADAYLKECLAVMDKCISSGLALRDPASMRLLRPTAHALAGKEGSMLLGGAQARAAIRAMAAAEWNASGGLIVAAPTAGSGGVLPAVLATLGEDFGMKPEERLAALWAAGAVGLAVAREYTFAGGVGGCQVEIGVAGAMAAAGIVEAALLRRESGPAPEAALAAATLFLQNSIGLACDPVGGFVELPCISRNAGAASQAFTCADLALAGWRSPIGFHDTILAMKDAGERMAPELRCTSLGGLASRPCDRQVWK